jgi:hypothetical protein
LYARIQEEAVREGTRVLAERRRPTGEIFVDGQLNPCARGDPLNYAPK